jgi:peptidoglycan/LPS O-acetylase OafA/YrhL
LVLSVTTSLITRLDLQVSLTFPIVLIVTLALSWLSLRLVDDPIQILRSRYRFR